MNDHLLRRVERYYTSRFEEHGATAHGVDWNSAESQRLRFEQLLTAARGLEDFSLLDYGCGYGALLSHLRETGCTARYVGLDVSEAMIEHARALHGDDGLFTCDAADVAEADVVVASGIFNVKLDTPDEEWAAYVDDTVDRLAGLARVAFAYNLLTSYSDAELMRPDLHYGDPLRHFDRCKRLHSRHVALLHDYGLWEFTIVVRKVVAA